MSFIINIADYVGRWVTQACARSVVSVFLPNTKASPQQCNNSKAIVAIDCLSRSALQWTLAMVLLALAASTAVYPNNQASLSSSTRRNCVRSLVIRYHDTTPRQHQSSTATATLLHKSELDTISELVQAAVSDRCPICLESQKQGNGVDDNIRVLQCSHQFHAHCIDPWLTACCAQCPLCKMDFGSAKNL